MHGNNSTCFLHPKKSKNPTNPCQSLHVVLVGEKCLNLHQQLLLHHIRHQGSPLGCDLLHQVVMCDVVQAPFSNNLYNKLCDANNFI